MANFVLSLFEDSLAQITFFSIFLAGMVFTLVSLLFGGDADSDFDADHGDFDHDVDHGHGVGHGDSGGADSHGPGFLSIRGASLMMVGFGGVAYIVQHLFGKVLLASVAGAMSGWVFAFACLAMFRVFLRQQATSGVTAAEIVGSLGVVTTSIPPGKPGEVMLSVSGRQMNKMATSELDEAIPSGARVKVDRYFGGTVIVSKV